jgi:hypothetical protein
VCESQISFIAPRCSASALGGRSTGRIVSTVEAEMGGKQERPLIPIFCQNFLTVKLLTRSLWYSDRNVMPPISSNADGPVRISAKNYLGRIAILFIVQPTVVNLRTTWHMERFEGPSLCRNSPN